MNNNFHLEESVMFYNVENLFLPDPKPKHIFDPTKSGLRNWTEERYSNKIFKIGHVAELVKEQYGQLPFLIGLSEIQGKQVLRDLLKNEIFAGYDFVHYESMDERGIDVALLYDTSKIKIEFSEPISFFFEMESGHSSYYDTTRDVLHCKVRYGNFPFHLFILHLPSKRENDINLPKREYIAKEISEKISGILSDENEAVIVCGDFNANPDEKILEKLTIDKNFNKILTNPYSNLYINKVFSTFHNKNGLLFDQILLSAHFFKPNSLLSFKNANVFSAEKLSSWDRKFMGRPFRTYSGTRYLGGYSDHFPVIVRLEINNSN